MCRSTRTPAPPSPDSHIREATPHQGDPMGNFDWSILTDLLKSGLDIASQIIKILQAAGVFG